MQPTTEAPGASSESQYIDGEYFEKNPDWHTSDSPWKASKILAMLERNNISPTSICDLGCGAGEILVNLQQALPDQCLLHGFDISPDALRLCEPKANRLLHFKLGSPLDTHDTVYDLVLLIDIIEHVADYHAFLKRIRPIGRSFILHIPLDLSAQALLRPRSLLETRRRVGHIHYFTRELALEALAEAGFSVLDSFFTAGSIELPQQRLQTRIAAWPRRALFAIRPDLCARVLGGCSLMVLAR